MSDIGLLEAITFTLLLVGLVGCLLPVLPGVLVMWLALAFYYASLWLQHGFVASQGALFALATVIAATGTTAEWWLSSLMATRGGASRRTTALALIGGLLALLLMPVGGVGAVALAVALPAVIVFVLEYRRDRDRRRSARAGCGFVTGWALATAVELAAGIWLLALWLVQL